VALGAADASAKLRWEKSPRACRVFDALVTAAELAARAVAIAGQLDHPVYDCLYLALAEQEQPIFVTADMQLVAKVRGPAWQP
jgi:predicted nucleic acid-binding protein